MPLRSFAFSGDARLNACLVENSSHVTPGSKGFHVKKIQAALEAVDGADIAQAEWTSMSYGPSTAAAVLAFKKKRDIINRSYQTQADNIVGIMTIRALDEEMSAVEQGAVLVPSSRCKCACRTETRGSTPGKLRGLVAEQLRPDPLFASSGALPRNGPFAVAGPVAAPRGPRTDAEFFKPDSNFDDGFDPKQPFQMIPLTLGRKLGVRTGGQACVLAAEGANPGVSFANISATPPLPPIPGNLASVILIPAHTIVHFDVFGRQVGQGVLSMRNSAGIVESLLLFSVKARKTVSVGARILSDITTRESNRSVSDAVETVQVASDFFERWTNTVLDMPSNPVKVTALKDLGNIIDLDNVKNRFDIAGAPTKETFNQAKPTFPPTRDIVIVFTWNLETFNRDPNVKTFGSTVANFCFVEDASVEPRLDNFLVVKHEFGHALGLNHHSGAPTLMAQNSFQMVSKLLMHEINTVNPSGIDPSP